MESMYSGSSPIDFIEENHSCPDFEKFIQKAENENSELVRLLEAETQQYSALQKELEDTNIQRDKLEHSSNNLNDEAKQLHRSFKRNKDISESLKRTNTLLSQHEETLQGRYESACSDLQEIRVQDGELVEKYRNTWKRYHAYYESSELAGHLAGTKKTALELQNKASDTGKKIKELEIQLISAEEEKNKLEESLKNGVKSSKVAIINLAELYIQASNLMNLANDKFHQLQKVQKKRQALENEMAYAGPINEPQEEEQMECEMEHTDSGGLQQKEGVIVIQDSTSNESTKHQQTTGMVDNTLKENPQHQQLHTSQGKSQDNLCRNTFEARKDLSPHQIEQQDTPIPLQSNPAAPQLCIQQSIFKGSLNNNRLIAFNAKGLTGYTGCFPSPLTPITSQAPLLSPARTTTQYQLINTFAKASTPSQQPQNLMHDSYDKATNQGINSEGQVGLNNSSEPRDKTAIEQTTVPSLECQEQTVEENYSAINNFVKSPSQWYNPISPKTPTTGSEHMDIFNFTEYSERMRQMNKSPGEGFSYQSRPMFDIVENMDDGNETIPRSLPGAQTSFFQPFFTPRESETNEQLTGKTTFFSMSPKINEENMVKQGNQFQVEKEQSSSFPNNNNLFSKSTPAEECGASPDAGFSLFGDQPASKLGSHGNNSPKSPAFTFNFSTSPSLTADKSTSQSGTFNLF